MNFDCNFAVRVHWLGCCCVWASKTWRMEKENVSCSFRQQLQPETYRDEWEDEDLVMEAQKDFLK